MPVSEIARERVREHFARDQVDACLIQRGTIGTTAPDSLETTGMANPVTVYSGRCRCGKASPAGQVELGEGEVATRIMTVQVPFDAAQIFVDDLLTVTAAIDGKLVDTTWRVTGSDGGGSWNALTSLSCSSWYPSAYWDGTE